MTTTIGAWAILAAGLLGQQEAVPKQAPSNPSSEAEIVLQQRKPYELRKAISAALRESAPAAAPKPQDVVPELIELFFEVKRDEQIALEDRLRLKGLLRTRLQSLADQLAKHVADGKEAEAKARRKLPPKVAAGALPPDVLAQQGGAGQGPGGAGGNGGGAPGGNRNGWPPYDHAQELIELIKRTIAPDTWDDAGGLGTIRYYRPLQVLVIRQTSRVHGSVGDALGGLRGGK